MFINRHTLKLQFNLRRILRLFLKRNNSLNMCLVNQNAQIKKAVGTPPEESYHFSLV